MLKSRDARPVGAPDTVRWTARVRWQGGLALARARGHDVPVLAPVRFTTGGDPAPAALDLLLCALGGEILSGFARAAAQAGLTLDAAEAAVDAWLENPLVAAGVVGEVGSPALAAAHVSLYASSPDPEPVLRAALNAALVRSPVHATLARACPVTVELCLIA